MGGGTHPPTPSLKGGGFKLPLPSGRGLGGGFCEPPTLQLRPFQGTIPPPLTLTQPRGSARGQNRRPSRFADRPRRRTPHATRPPQPPLLRGSGPGHLRPRVRPATARTHRHREGPPGAGHPRQPDAAGRRGAHPRLREGHPQGADAVHREQLRRGRPAEVRRRRAEGARPGREGRVRGRAEDRRRVDVDHLRGRETRLQRDSRQRRRGRQRHPQPEDHLGHPAETRRPEPAEGLRGPRRGLHDEDRVRPRQQAGGAEARRAAQEPAQPHRRHAQTARPEGDRQAEDDLLRLRHRGDGRHHHQVADRISRRRSRNSASR